MLGKGKGTGVEVRVINAFGGRKKMMKEKGQRRRNQERMEGRKFKKLILKKKKVTADPKLFLQDCSSIYK